MREEKNREEERRKRKLSPFHSTPFHIGEICKKLELTLRWRR
jgi:hypothetical protein